MFDFKTNPFKPEHAPEPKPKKKQEEVSPKPLHKSPPMSQPNPAHGPEKEVPQRRPQ